MRHLANDHTTQPRSPAERIPPVPDRIVKPRRTTAQRLPVVAIGTSNFLSESGEIGQVCQLVDLLPDYETTLFCTVGAADFVAMLNSIYLLRTPNTWQFRVATSERNVCLPTKEYKVTRASVAIHYFGWHRNTSKGNVFHKIIDPVTIYGQRIDDIWPGEDRTRQLLEWGIALRDFCNENNLTVRPTMGSIAGQFLTDKRFYPNARRKVPAKINARVRENLPGNHYMLNVHPDPSNNFNAHYLDQHRAHHYHTRTSPLPDSNSCYAYGDYVTLERGAFGDVVPSFCGLYCLDLEPPPKRSPFDWVGEQLGARFIYSNELSHLADAGYRVASVRAAWGSPHRDIGIAKYAVWAEEQLDRYGDPPWLKPLLLATYGTLATRPVSRESIFRIAKKGEPVTLRTGRHRITGLRVASPRKLEPPIAHLLQRGLIEAATRSESIGLAQWLHGKGYTVLSIYADAVMVEADDDKPLPEFIPDPWRVKKTLSHLQFINQQAFLSDSMTKLPGVGRELMKYRQDSPGYAPRFVEYTQYEALTSKLVEATKRYRRI